MRALAAQMMHLNRVEFREIWCSNFRVDRA